MTYIREDLTIGNTSLPTLGIEKDKLYTEYTIVGSGNEGKVFNYEDRYAIKIFREETEYTPVGYLPRKYEKIEELANMIATQGPSEDLITPFPIGLVYYKGERIIRGTENKEGFYENIIIRDKTNPTFFTLFRLLDPEKIPYIKMGGQGLRKLHQMGFVLGDIKSENILITQSKKVAFIDSDNWKFGNFDYDLPPINADYLRTVFGDKEYDSKDNDKFLLALESMQVFLKGQQISNDRGKSGFHSRYFFNKLIEMANLQPEEKEGLRQIFSDSPNKPYIDEVLNYLDPEIELYSKKAAKALARTR